MTRTDKLAAGAAAAFGLGILVAVLLGSWRWSMVLGTGLALLLAAVVLLVMRRQEAARAAALKRLERKIDELAVRVVTESQATHQELGGLIEELGETLKDS